MTDNQSECTVYFTGAPASVTEKQIRDLFETLGHIHGLRLFPNPVKPTQHGFVDYGDAGSARAAVERLNGHVFAPSATSSVADASLILGGEYKLKVDFAISRKRQRQQHQHQAVLRQHAANAAADAACYEDGEAVGNIPAGPPLVLPAHYRDPVATALRSVAVADAFEAVEQLRVLALEKPDETKVLLETQPALKVAVIQILQFAKRLPPHLPPEALPYHTHSHNNPHHRHGHGHGHGHGHHNSSSNSQHPTHSMGGPLLSGPSAALQQTAAALLDDTTRQQAAFGGGSGGAGGDHFAGGGGATAVYPSASTSTSYPPPPSSSSSNMGDGGGGVGGAATGAVPTMAAADAEAKLEKLSEAQVLKLMGMSPADFSKLKEPVRTDLMALQAYLKGL